MVIIPGFIISTLTFPGVIVHEFAHKLFCHWTGTKVIKVCYFRVGNPAGFVVHEIPSSTWKHILIGIGPFIINSFAGALFGLLLVPMQRAVGGVEAFTVIIVMWVAVSVAMHSFPSTGDAKSMWAALWRPESSTGAKLVGVPLVGLIYLGAIGSVFWLNLIYGIAVIVGIPILLHLNR